MKLQGSRYLVHRVVAAAFLGACPPGREVNHKDHDYTNNAASNLEYVTRSENMLHSHRSGRRRAEGEGHGLTKLTVQAVAEMRRRHAAGGITLARLAEEFGVTPSAAGKVVHRKAWKHVKE